MAKRAKTIISGAGFYTVLAVCLVAVGAGAYFLLFDGGGSAPTAAEADASAASSAGESPADARETAGSAAIAEQPPVPVQGATQEEEPDDEPALTVDTVDQAPVAAAAPSLVVSPLSGEVVAAFSVDQLQYSPTLDDWRTHDGIDISAAAGTKVLAAAAGTVLSVEDDELMGTTVVLSHAGGYQTTYASLQAKPTVKKGETVSAGQVLGAVGATALAESAEGPHLHFSVAKNGDAVDPSAYLKK